MNKLYLILLVFLITSCSQVKQQELKTFSVDVENITQDYKECRFHYYCDTKSDDLNLCVKTIMIVNTIETMNNSNCKDYNQALRDIADKVSKQINQRYSKLQFQIEKIILL
jgi:ABC-type dipeptide/oligopeptide/nickel transport system ATPase component